MIPEKMRKHFDIYNKNLKYRWLLAAMIILGLGMYLFAVTTFILWLAGRLNG